MRYPPANGVVPSTCQSLVAIVAAALTATASAQMLTPFQEATLAHSLDRGQIDFADEWAVGNGFVGAWWQRQFFTGGATKRINGDPIDPMGRSVLETITEGSTDSVIMHWNLEYQRTGQANTAPFGNPAPHETDEFRVIGHLYWDWERGTNPGMGTPPNAGSRQTMMNLVENGSIGPAATEVAAWRLRILEGEIESIELDDGVTDYTFTTSFAQFRNTWSTFLFEYKAASSGMVDGDLSFTMCEGLKYTADDVRNDATAVNVSTNHAGNRLVGAIQIANSNISHSREFRSAWRTIAWRGAASEAPMDDPYIVDKMTVGQLRDFSDTAGNIWLLGPAGVWRDDWRLLGSYRVAVKYWETDAGEGTAIETPKVTLTEDDWYFGNVRVTGITPATTDYSFKIIAYHPTDDLDRIEFDRVLSFRKPDQNADAFKWGYGVCQQHSGTAHPWHHFDLAVEHDARFFVLNDDPYYVDGYRTNTPDNDDLDPLTLWLAHIYEASFDYAMTRAGYVMPIYFKHGDHQWDNELTYAGQTGVSPGNNSGGWGRFSNPNNWKNGLRSWWLWAGQSMEGYLDGIMQIYSEIDDAEFVDHLARSFDFGPYRMTFIDDVTLYYPDDNGTFGAPNGNTSLLGDIPAVLSGERAALVNAVTGSDRTQLLFSTRVNGPRSTDGSDVSLQNGTFYNLTGRTVAEWDALMDDILAVQTGDVAVFSGDCHIWDLNTGDNSKARWLFEHTAGPSASKRFGTLLINDWSLKPTAYTTAGREWTRLFTATDGVDSESMVRRFSMITHLNDRGFLIEGRRSDPTDELFYSSDLLAFTDYCPCEIDQLGDTNVDDLLAFLAPWFADLEAGVPLGGRGTGGDIDNDDDADIDDLLAFLACWFAVTGGAPCIGI